MLFQSGALISALTVEENIRLPMEKIAKIPKDMDPKTITEAQAKELLENKPKTRRRPIKRTRGKSTTKTTKKAAK